ncbi:MAG: 30S ribosome-binding factor RbfA [Clostridia bacterium]|nr:30S ribosome-binding factor RbfA [Clostridia bacterium]
MSSDRMEKINTQLQKAVSDIIKKLKDPRLKGIISVTGVKASRDLKNADISISVFDSNGADFSEIIEILNNSAGFIRNELFRILDLRSIPRLRFAQDNAMEYSQRINRILEDIKNEKK